jgi:hypothetical protein
MSQRQFIRTLLVPPLIFASYAGAQICGNPAGTGGKALVAMSISGGVQTLDHGDQRADSRRMFVKTSYGLASGLDVYGLLGGVRLDMESGKAGITVTDGRTRFAYGAGFSLSLNPAGRPANGRKPVRMTARRTSSGASIGFWGGGHVVRYPADAVYQQTIDVAGSAFIRKFELNYECTEWTGHAGFIVPLNRIKLYAGGVGWGIQRMDTKREFLINEAESVSQSLGKKKGKYQSGTWTGGLAGIQFDLPQNYAISAEVIAFNRQYFQVMVGISQSGLRTW